MLNFTDSDLLKLDEGYAVAGVPFHARPLRAAAEILGAKFAMGVGGNSLVEDICEAYARLIPEVKYTWPGMGTGIVASLDRVRKVTVGVAYGTGYLSVDRGLGLSSHKEWAAWCRHDRFVADRSAFALADMHDIVYGIDRVRSERECGAVAYWALAAEQLKLVAESLSQSGAVSSPVLQPICLTAELAMKGTLLDLGIAEKSLRSYGHDLNELCGEMTSRCRHRDDSLLSNFLSRFPNYVADRYRETQLSRIDVIDLALSAQFVSASAVRRISGVDLALQMEADGLGPRAELFCGVSM